MDKNMQGKIVKGISGFYYVHVAGSGIYECKAKGIFRNQKIKPLVGDNVTIAVLDEEQMLGNIEEILPRENALIRPAVANIDQALVIFAAVVYTSAREQRGIDALLERLDGKVTSVAGPSGVGKSSIINCLQPERQMETGAISRKIERGRHTTRHSEIIPIKEQTYIMDTPGFSTLDIPGLKKEDLWWYYPEFEEYEPNCRFKGCSHIGEPDCGVKEAVEAGKISRLRYENYMQLYQELKEQKKY